MVNLIQPFKLHTIGTGSIGLSNSSCYRRQNFFNRFSSIIYRICISPPHQMRSWTLANSSIENLFIHCWPILLTFCCHVTFFFNFRQLFIHDSLPICLRPCNFVVHNLLGEKSTYNISAWKCIPWNFVTEHSNYIHLIWNE